MQTGSKPCKQAQNVLVIIIPASKSPFEKHVSVLERNRRCDEAQELVTLLHSAPHADANHHDLHGKEERGPTAGLLEASWVPLTPKYRRCPPPSPGQAAGTSRAPHAPRGPQSPLSASRARTPTQNGGGHARPHGSCSPRRAGGAAGRGELGLQLPACPGAGLSAAVRRVRRA